MDISAAVSDALSWSMNQQVTSHTLVWSYDYYCTLRGADAIKFVGMTVSRVVGLIIEIDLM